MPEKYLLYIQLSLNLLKRSVIFVKGLCSWETLKLRLINPRQKAYEILECGCYGFVLDQSKVRVALSVAKDLVFVRLTKRCEVIII